MKSTAEARINGVRHVALTVSNLERSASWYANVLRLAEVFRESHTDRSTAILRVPDGELIIGLVEFHTQGNYDFSPQRVGLDHLCFAVASRADLEAWTSRLDDCQVAHSGVVEMATSPIVNFKGPDGVALAFAISPPAAIWARGDRRHLRDLKRRWARLPFSARSTPVSEFVITALSVKPPHLTHSAR